MAGQNSVVNYLTAKQAYDYMDEVKKNDNLFILIRESFKLKMDITKGVTKDEMNEVVDATTDPDLKNALKGVTLVGDSKTLLTLDNTERTKYRKALVVYERRTDGKYNVLVVYATQVKVQLLYFRQEVVQKLLMTIPKICLMYFAVIF